MILHALTMRNWRNIGQLELAELNHAVVVLYGPNRTGKSSIVAAIRSCLLDDDHDSTKASVKDSIPWHDGSAIPEIRIEFETGGKRYCVLKRYSKGKQGGATLELLSGAGRSLVAEGKEVTRQTRRILGVDRSPDGLNQLLWLSQGETQLPAEKELNEPLKKRFEEVLGSLLTGRDFDFRRALRESCDTYFTPTLASKKDSPLARLEADLAARQEALNSLLAKRQQTRQQRDEFERLSEGLVELRRGVQESESEVRRLQAEQLAARQRKAAFDQAVSQAAAKTKELEGVMQRRGEYLQAKARLAECSAALVSAEAAYHELVERHAARQQELQQAQAAERAAQLDLDRCDLQRGELEDRRKLLDLSRRIADARDRLARYDELARRLAECNAELAQLRAPSKEELEALRKNREQATRHRATLEAGEIQVAISPACELLVTAEIDHHEGLPEQLSVSQQRAWQVRQRAVLQIDGVGEVAVQRGQEDRKLETVARQLEELNQEFSDKLRSFGLASHLPAPLAELDDRRSRREQLAAEAQRLAQQQAELAPQGTSTLQAALAQAEAGRQAILERMPQLVDWSPDPDDLESRQRGFQRRLKELKAAAEHAAGETAAAGRRAADASDAMQNARVDFERLRTTVHNSQQELQRLGDEHSLQQACQAAQQACDEARQRVDACQLTPDEQRIDDRLRVAESAREARHDRLRQCERRLGDLRVELRCAEGLHENLAGLEADLEQVRKQTEQQRLRAEAHQHLLETFEACRSEHVQRTTGAIGERVLLWARRMGLSEYGELDFAEGYLPQAVRRHDIAQHVPLDADSFGTVEQLSILVRLAVGGVLAKGEPQLVILDDPLTHADHHKHRRMQEILAEAAAGSPPLAEGQPPLGRLQILVFTCHPERFDHIPKARRIDLAQQMAGQVRG